MNIYTYYDEVLENQIEIIEIWKESWRKNGWNPIVLDQQSINCSDVEIEYLENLPSVNPKKYEMACFLRWNAMSNIGGGWMCDYDVINLGFSPDDSKKYESVSILQGHVPCLVYGTSEDYMDIFRIFATESMSFITMEDNRPHTSDMIVISNIANRESMNCLNIVDGYPKKEESILIHCSAGSCASMNMTKKEAMISIL
jgi:hypothetical protein